MSRSATVPTEEKDTKESQKISALLKSYYTQPGSQAMHPSSANSEPMKKEQSDVSHRVQESHGTLPVSNVRNPYQKTSTQSKQQHTAIDAKTQESVKKMDSPTFNVTSFFKETVETISLKGLLDFNNELVLQIKTLDADMRALVYENYYEFIAASDIIQKVKAHFEDMEEDAEGLSSSMDIIRMCAQQVHDAVISRSSKIEELVAVRQLLTKLSLLFQLPKLMHESNAEGRYDDSMKAFMHCKAFLEQHKNISKCKDTLERCTELYADSKSAIMLSLPPIQGHLETAATSVVSLTAAIDSTRKKLAYVLTVLLECGESPLEVYKLYVDNANAMLLALLDIIFDESKILKTGIISKEAAQSRVSNTLAPANANGSAARPSGEKQRDGSIERAFNNSQKTSDNEPFTDDAELDVLIVACESLSAYFIDSLLEDVSGLKSMLQPWSEDDGNLDQRVDLFLRDIMKALFEKLSYFFKQRKSTIHSAVSAINLVRAGISSVYRSIPQNIEELFVNFVREATEVTLNIRFTDCYNEIYKCINNLATNCKDTTIDDFMDKIGSAENSFLVMTCEALTECLPLVTGILGSTKAIFQQLAKTLLNLTTLVFELFNSFCEKICANMFLKSFEHSTSMKDSAGSGIKQETKELISFLIQESGKWDWNSLFTLGLVRIGRHFQVKGILNVISVLAETLSATPESENIESTLRGELKSEREAVASALCQNTRQTAQNLLTAYAFSNGNALSLLMYESMEQTNWMMDVKPFAIRNTIETILHELHTMDIQVGRFLGDPRKPSTADSHHRGISRVLSGKRNYIQLEMERLYARRLAAYALVPFNRSAVVAAILRILLKSWVEFIRQETFNGFGVQQIQVDCTVMADTVKYFISADDSHNVDAFVDEIIFSAHARCIEAVDVNSISDNGVLMSVSEIEAICDDSRMRLNY